MSPAPAAPATVLYQDRVASLAGAESTGDDLWLSLPDLKAAASWEIKPEGVCRDDLCIPIPDARRPRLLRGSGVAARFNLTEFARLIEQPFAHDDAHNIWCFGQPGWLWKQRLTSQQAPDFTLPDFQGKPHSLSDFRGRKLFLLAWASW